MIFLLFLTKWNLRNVFITLWLSNFHGRAQNSFLDRAKGYFNIFITKLLFKLAILYLKFHKCQIPGPGNCLVLPIGADADGNFDHINWMIPIIDDFYLLNGTSVMCSHQAYDNINHDHMKRLPLYSVSDPDLCLNLFYVFPSDFLIGKNVHPPRPSHPQRHRQPPLAVGRRCLRRW